MRSRNKRLSQPKDENPKIAVDDEDQSWSAVYRHNEFLKTPEGQERLAKQYEL